MSEAIQLTKEQIKPKRLIYLYASAVGLLVLGLIYGWSIFAGPLGIHTGYDKGALQITFTLSIVCFFSGALLSSFINKVLSIKITLIIAAVLLLLGFAGTALFAKTDIIFIYISYGVLCAVGCGFGYNTLISSVGLWFPDKTGFASGVMMMGFGLGSLILGQIVSVIIKPIEEAGIGVETTFYILAVIAFIVVLVLAFLIKVAPSNIVAEMAPEKLSAGSAEKPKIKDGFALSSPTFWVYLVYATCAICIGLTLIGSAKGGGVAVGLDVGMATLLVGLVSVMNGISRVIVGLICDKAGVKVAIGIIVTVGILTASGVAASYAFAPTMPYLYLISAICMGFSYGGIAVGAAAFAREAFGAKNFPTNLALCNIAGVPAAFLSQIVISATSSNGTAEEVSVWFGIIGVAVVAILGVIVFSLLYRKRKA